MSKDKSCQNSAMLLFAGQLFYISTHSGCTINRRESNYSPKITVFKHGVLVYWKEQIPTMNWGFSFSLAWRETVSTALVYNYWRHCWQQSTLCGLGADQRHYFSLVSLHTCLYCSAHMLAIVLKERKKVWIGIYVHRNGNDVMQNSRGNLIISSKLSNTFSFDSLDSFANTD